VLASITFRVIYLVNMREMPVPGRYGAFCATGFDLVRFPSFVPRFPFNYWEMPVVSAVHQTNCHVPLVHYQTHIFNGFQNSSMNLSTIYLVDLFYYFECLSYDRTVKNIAKSKRILTGTLRFHGF
jgi:hypothetical protein